MFQQRIAEIVNPTPERSSHIGAQYDAAVKETLERVLSDFASPREVYSKMRGMFPPDVLVRSGGRIPGCKNAVAAASHRYHPELHALDYEWYFTNDTARDLSHEFASKSGLTICLGAPKVATAGIHSARKVIFVDRNPCVLTRFPELGRSEEVHLMDAIEAARLNMHASTVVFDSPWYLPDIVGWLFSASQLVKVGGSIIFALYPPLIRPTAKLERDLVLEIASSIGTIELQEEVLAYETPLFEHEALNASGLGCLREWRRADVVRISVAKRLTGVTPDLLHRSPIDGVWRSFVIGDQVVKVRSRSRRLHTSRREKELLMPVGSDFLLQSVSVRSPLRGLVDVWTSRNRVACSSASRLVSLILRRLAKGEPLHEAIHSYKVPAPAKLEYQMHKLLGMEA